LRKFLWILYQPYKWLIFIPLALILTLLFGFFTVAVYYLSNPRIASYLGGVIWARVLCIITPIRLRKTGKKNIQKKQSYVIVANHSSSFDILVLYARLGVDFKWVMKQELRKVPGLGVACEKLGHIFIDRSSPKAALETIAKAKSSIKDGTCIVFFPEGTRNKKGELADFKKGAFKMAFDLNLPILPVSVKGTNKIHEPDTLNIFPGTATLIFHPPIHLENYAWENVDELMKHARDVISSGLRD
jgi:1-acyl-sn-glycerol-3-phosphate acyltransferase